MDTATLPALPILRGSAAESFAYWGEREGWYIALSQHRDSDALDRSNWRTIAPPMLAAHPDDAAIESMSNWAVGWVEYLLVRPGTAAETAALEWRDNLADYPVADESDWSALEWEDNHADDGYCYAGPDDDCHAVDDRSRIVQRRDTLGRFAGY